MISKEHPPNPKSRTGQRRSSRWSSSPAANQPRGPCTPPTTIRSTTDGSWFRSAGCTSSYRQVRGTDPRDRSVPTAGDWGFPRRIHRRWPPPASPSSADGAGDDGGGGGDGCGDLPRPDVDDPTCPRRSDRDCCWRMLRKICQFPSSRTPAGSRVGVSRSKKITTENDIISRVNYRTKLSHVLFITNEETWIILNNRLNTSKRWFKINKFKNSQLAEVSMLLHLVRSGHWRCSSSMVTGFVVVCRGGCRASPAVFGGRLLFGTFWWTAPAGSGSTRRRMPAGRGAFTGTFVVLEGVGLEEMK